MTIIPFKRPEVSDYQAQREPNSIVCGDKRDDQGTYACTLWKGHLGDHQSRFKNNSGDNVIGSAWPNKKPCCGNFSTHFKEACVLTEGHEGAHYSGLSGTHTWSNSEVSEELCSCWDVACQKDHIEPTKDDIENEIARRRTEHFKTCGCIPPLGCIAAQKIRADVLDFIMDAQANINAHKVAEKPAEKPKQTTDQISSEGLECPFCKNKDDKLLYAYKCTEITSEGTKTERMVYCSSCNTEYDLDTGKKSWALNDEEKPAVNQKPETKKVDPRDQKHQMIMEKAMWVCQKEGCDYTTSSPTSATDHDGPGKERHYAVKGTQNGVEGYVCRRPKCDYFEKDSVTAFRHDDPVWSGSTGSGGYGYTSYTDPLCDHPPKQVIQGSENKWGVWSGKKFDCVNDVKAGNFDVVMNLCGPAILSGGHDIPIPELKKWEGVTANKTLEMVLNWPDFGVVQLPKEFWIELIEYLSKNEYKMLVFCFGGHGRTGTAVAALMMFSLDWTPEKAIKWVRTNHCKKAIEGWNQENYLFWLAGRNHPSPKYEGKHVNKGKKQHKSSGVTVTHGVNSSKKEESDDHKAAWYEGWLGD